MGLFKRKVYDELLRWKDTSQGRSAILVEGARRVGKSTLVEAFVRNEYRSHILIDFSNMDEDLRNVFRNPRDLDRFFLFLQQMFRTTLYRRESAIVFDEVQLFPPARQMIKHLVADGRYDYIETGSLLSIKQNVRDILIPSEEESIRLHPMDFEEYLWAIGDEQTIPLIRRCFIDREPLGRTMHERIMAEYRLYMLMGGMPQAISAYLETNNLSEVEKAKRSILNLYRNDSVKIEYGGGEKAGRILELVPSYLSNHDKSFSPGEIKQDGRTRDYLKSVGWLKESMIINVCVDNYDPSPALSLNLDENKFKMYMLDTGLLVTSAMMADSRDAEELYEAMLRGKLQVNEGMFFENMVSQELVAAGHRLVYTKFTVKDTDNIQEVDFLISDGSRIVPVECKSGNMSSRHKSLDRLMGKYGRFVDTAYVVHSKDLRVDGSITYIPIYMSMFL